MKMKIWIEEAMKEMVEEVEKMNRCQNIGNAMCCCSACCRPFVFRRDFGCWQKTALLPLIEALFSLQLALSVLCWWELC